VRGYRTGENPARWRGHLDKLLPASLNRKRRKHHAALPYGEAGTFMEGLRAQQGTAARALEFTILNVPRTDAAIRAKPAEFDLDKGVWTIPVDRMLKSGREHRVPLSHRSLEIVKAQMKANPKADYVFPGAKAGAPLSNMAMLELLRRMGRDDLTVHGFRSTFRDWAAECTGYPNEVCEMALAHTIGSEVEAAYRRGDLFEKRRRLMLDWAKYCDAPARDQKIMRLAPRRA
jgi:integrase